VVPAARLPIWKPGCGPRLPREISALLLKFDRAFPLAQSLRVIYHPP
jgi:hypothetical protein